MIAGRYTLGREIGRGGMGAVYVAHDEVLGREVAVKRIGMLPGASMPDLARAEREARLAATLNHPHVVSVFDLVEEQDHHWLVMEYVEGESLAERIRSSGPLDHASAANIMWQVADALAAAHRAGITHRDVKPSNIMVSADGQAKLTDFGIARAQADATLTQTGLVTGSPAYLAPEVASGAGASAASDVWSLGATLFHALTGAPPYDVSENLIGGLYKIVHEEPPRVPDAGNFEDLLRATMTREPSDRWSMQHVRDRLAEIRLDPTAAQMTSTAVLSDVTAPPTAVLAPVAVVPVTPVAASPVGAVPETVLVPDQGIGRSRWPWLAALAAAVVVVAITILVLTSGNNNDTPAADDPAPSTTTEPSETPSSPTTNPAATTRKDVTAFISNYLATVTSDPQTSFEMLTPDFQARSGGFGKYSGFWGTIASATPSNIVVDPAALTVSYDVFYKRVNGTTASGSPTLQLQRTDDGYLIAGES